MNTSTSAAGFIKHMDHLPALPCVLQQVLAVADAPNSSADDLARALSADPGIAASVLRLINSAFYGLRGKISQVSRAVVLLGRQGVRNLVLGISVHNTVLTQGVNSPEHVTIWRHSLATAAASDLIARQIGLKPAEEAFIGGLLHDIGQLIMVRFSPDDFNSTCTRTINGGGFLSVETEQFGLDHTQVGNRLLSRWGLPASLCEVVLHHHSVEVPTDSPMARLLSVIILADSIAQIMGFGLDISIGSSRRVETAAKFLNFDETDQSRIFDGLPGRIEQTMEMFQETAKTWEPEVPDRVRPKQAIWVSAVISPERGIGQLLLEQNGYEVRRVTPAQFLSMLDDSNDLVIVAPGGQANGSADVLAQTIAERGCRRVVLLAEPKSGMSYRKRNEATGVLAIPALFTVHDLNWVEQELSLCLSTC